MSSMPQIFHNFLAVKDQPNTLIVDELYVATSGELYRRFDGLRPSLKSCSKEPGPHDLISRLSDEILLVILSRLTTEEVVRTSVLSTRWATLWWYSPKLCFYSLPRLIDRVLLNEDSSHFISWVNRVLQLHQASALDEFLVHVETLDYGYLPVESSVISAWVYYALSRRVKRLELSFLNFTGYQTFSNQATGFGVSYLYSRRPSFTKRSLDYCYDFNSLKEVSFCALDVGDGVIEYLLLKCGRLERLSVLCAKSLNNLVVSSSSLRYLNIIYVEDLLISAEVRSCPNLKTLILDYIDGVKLKDIPRVTELHVYAYMFHCLPLSEGIFSCLLSQIEVLMLHSFNLQTILELGQVPELIKVKTLLINLGEWRAYSLMELTSFAAASPNLQKFVLELYCEPLRVRRELKRMNPPLNMEHLKIVEVAGYYGSTREDELIVSLLENAAAAEKLILNPRNSNPLTCIPFFRGIPQAHDTAAEETVRDYARLLPELVPNHVEVIVL